MADDEEILDAEGEEEELNIVAIVVAAVLILALIGGAVWYFFLREKPVAQPQAEKVEWVAPKNVQEEHVIDALPEMIINPSDSQGRYFLLVKIDIIANDPSLVSREVSSKPWRLPEVQNLIIDVFSGYTIDELRTPKFKDEARQRIVDRLNELAGWKPNEQAKPGEEKKLPPVKDIYFEKYILQ